MEKSANFLYQKMDEARNYVEVSQAEAYDNNMLATELLKADTAVDKLGRPRQGSKEDFEDHDTVFKQSENEIGKFFSNKEVEARYKSERQKNIIATRTQIARKYRENMIDSGKASTVDTIQSTVQSYAFATDENKPIYEKKIKDTINEAIRLGLMKETDAQKLQYDSIQDARYNAFLVDFRANPEEAEKAFNSGKYGFDIETSEKARVRLKEMKVLYREVEGERYNELQNKLYSGNLSEVEIDNLEQANKNNPNEGITSAHAKSIKGALYRDITKRIGEKEYKKQKAAIDFIFSSSTRDKIKGYEAILAAYTDGLTNDESAFLTKIMQTKKDILWANKAKAGKKFLEQLFGARPKDVKAETKSLLDYARRIANGLDPEQAARDTATEIIKEDHPAVVANPDLVGAFSPTKGYKNIPKVKQESK